MADHSKPVSTDSYTNWPTLIDGRFDDITRMLDPAFTSPTNLPTNAIRFNSATKRFEKWNGSAWVVLQSAADWQAGFALGTAPQSYSPTIALGTPGTSSFAYSTQEGSYHTIGKLVFVAARVIFNPSVGTGTGTVRVSLPIAADAGEYHLGITTISREGAGDGWNWPSLTGGSTATAVSALAGNGNAFALIRGLGNSGLTANFGVASLTDGSAHTIAFSGIYFAA